jgi:Trypsin-like peptidase domain
MTKIPEIRAFSFAALVLLSATIGLTAPVEQARAVPPLPEIGGQKSEVRGQKSESIHAVVRIPSHGGSATVILSQAGKSYLLCCSHCFRGEAARPGGGPIELDVPAAKARRQSTAQCRLVDIDDATDLALLELDDGPLDYIAPVAPSDRLPGRNLVSVGYDDMQTPATVQAASIVAVKADRTFTREKPWHGRSGGALLDRDSGQLIGVVQGYEIQPGGRGIYASHGAILRFLGRQRRLPKPIADRPPARLIPRVMPYAR